MGLYLGSSEKLKIKLGDNVAYSANLFSALSAIEEIILLSSDNCLLKDSNGLYLSPLLIEEEI